MLEVWINILFFVFFVSVGGFFGFVTGCKYKNKLDETRIGSAEKEAKRIIDSAVKSGKIEKQSIILQGRDEAIKFKTEIDKELSDRRREITKAERKLQEKEESIEEKFAQIDAKNEDISDKIRIADKKLEEAEDIKKKQIELLEKISNFSKDQAKNLIIERLESELLREKAIKIRNFERQIKDESDKKARNILSGVMQRIAAEYVAETTVSVIILPNDDMKGRIIGREGRNIRTIETLTGVDLIIDDTPETIAISTFDPLRREIARIALEKLILDGRIHPTNIEEMIKRAKKEIDETVKLEGEKAVIEAKVAFLHPEVINLLGKLYYRTSYGQNVLKHSLEVSYLCGMIAAEIGADRAVASRAGLLHDIGKALSHTAEGSHVDIGIEIVKKYEESQEIIHAIESHHGDVEPRTAVAFIVQIADAISAARPGARKENIEGYIKRLEKLEEVASSFEGVERCFAIQAGREIRIIVNPEKIKDDEMVILAKDISKKVESDITFPGQIKINMIRESRAVDYAR